MVCNQVGGSSHRACPTIIQEDILARPTGIVRSRKFEHFIAKTPFQEASCCSNRHEPPCVMQPSKTRIVEICAFLDRMRIRGLRLVF
jgi:hypothetical protein